MVHDITAAGPIRTTSVATLATVVAVLPVFFVGASGIFLREDLEFNEAGLGLSIAAYMATAATFAVTGGRIPERIGAWNALALASLGSGMVMLGVATLARSFVHLVLVLAIGGFWNSIAIPAGNLALARSGVARPALMFGVKQSAIPVATLLAGSSVPTISLTVGWRWSFALGAALAGGVALLVPRQSIPTRARSLAGMREGDAATAPLVALAVAIGMGTGAAVSLASFLVEAGAAAGIAVATAGWLLVAGSIAGALARLFVGWLADHNRGWALYTVSIMLIIGAGGYGMLAVGEPVFLTIGTLLAYGGGWGWTGLLFFAVVRLNPSAPAAATGIVSAGGASGAALGPLLFGYVVTASSFRVAWSLTAGVACLSAGMVFAARAWLVRDRFRRRQMD